jgi:hypothetical protein
MARINVEDSIYKDTRFLELTQKTGSFEMALGSLVRVWSTAQEYFLKANGGIPQDIWDRQKLRNEVIDCGLAYCINGQVFVEGAEKQFGWLRQRSNAGKKPKTRKQDVTKERSLTVASISDRLETSSSSSSSTSKEEYNTHTSKVPEIEESVRSSISPDRITNLWNDVLSSKLKHSHGIGVGKHLVNFIDSRKFFDTPEKWEDYFVKILNTPFLIGGGPNGWNCTLQWAVNYDNALMVLDGAYDKANQAKIALDAYFGTEEG